MRSQALLGSAISLIGYAAAWPAPRGDETAPQFELYRRQAGTIAPNVTISIDPAYPTNVGFAGPVRNGTAPFLAETNRINTTKPITGRTIEDRYEVEGASSNSTFDITKHWGNTSPWFPSPLFPEAQSHRQLDESCSIDRVFILHRHGDRYPTSYSTEGAPYFGSVIANATQANNLSVSGPLSFLSNWTYQLGAEVLTPFGAQELFDSGIKAYYEYGRLYNASTQPKPVVRTTSEQRMLDSARYWTAGFFGLDAPNLINLQVILEDDGLK